MSDLLIRNIYSITLNVPANGFAAGDFEFAIPEGYTVAAITLICGSVYIFTEMETVSGKFKAKNHSANDKEVIIRAHLLLLKV